MAGRRFFLFCGEHLGQGTMPVGIDASAYNSTINQTGDALWARGDLDLYWRVVHGRNNSGIGVLAYIHNHIGRAGGTKSNPVPTLDWYEALHAGVFQNAHTDPLEGGAYRSAWRGPECSFLLRAHGWPSDDGIDNDLTRDPTFTLKKGSARGRLIPKHEFIGRVGSVVSAGGNDVDITLAGSVAHGKSPSATFTVWIAGIAPQDGVDCDQQLIAKHTATADTTDPGKFRITLPAPYDGNAGRAGSGIVCSPYFTITAIANPSGNTVRLTLAHPIIDDSQIVGGQDGGLIHIGDVSSTASSLDGRRSVVSDSLAFHKTINANTLVSFDSGTKRISLSSGSWARTPLAGETLLIAGSSVAANNKQVTVVAATSNTITVSETLTTAAAGTAITIHTLHILEFDYGAAVNVAGYGGEGFLFARPHWHPVFSGDCGSSLLFDELVTRTLVVDTHGQAALNVLGPAYAGDTVGDDESAIMCCLGYNDSDVTAGTDRQTALVQSFGQLYYEFLRDLRTTVASTLSSSIDPEDIGLVVAEYAFDADAVDYSGTTTAAQASILGQTRLAVARLEKAIFVEWSDLPLGDIGIAPTTDTWVELGHRLWEANQRLNETGSAVEERIGLPIYVLAGQSQTSGPVPNTVTLPQPLYTSGDPDHDGSWYDSSYTTVIRERGFKIWNALTRLPEEYAPAKNAVTYTVRCILAHPTNTGNLTQGVGQGGVGVEAALGLELRKRHPEGFLLIKVAVPAAALQAVTGLPTFDPGSNDLAADLLSIRDDVFAWCFANGRVPDMRAFFFDQGEGDAFPEWSGSYETALRNFVQWARDNFQTSSSSRQPLPFVIGRVQTHARNSSTWATHLPIIQAAQDAVAASMTNVAIASMQGLAIAADNVHRVWHSLLIAGQRLNDALDSTSIGTDAPELDEGASINPEITHGESSGSGQALAGTASEDAQAGATAAAAAVSSELLDQVEAAISTFITNGAIQTYTVGGRTVTRAQLGELRAWRSQLKAELSSARGSSRNYFQRGAV